MALPDLPPHQLVNIPIGSMPSVAVCLEVVLPRPPFCLAVCTRGTDEAFQCTFGRSLVVSSRLVVAITIVFS